jgi:tight adherence protein B
MELIALLAGGLCGYGILLLGQWARGAARSFGPKPQRFHFAAHRTQVIAAIACAALSAIITQWPVAVVAALFLGYNLPGLAGALFPRRIEIERAEAVAIWVEMLRDVTVIGMGIRDTIHVTVSSAPPLIAQTVARLDRRLQSDYRNNEAHYAALADELDSPTGDLVAMALARFDRGGVGEVSRLLDELAATAREDVSMRRRTATAQRRPQTTVRGVIGVFLVIVIAGKLISPSYLATYQSTEGQVVLAIVIAMFVAGLWWMIRLSRHDVPQRFRLSVMGVRR